MSDFLVRWRQLASAARRHEQDSGATAAQTSGHIDSGRAAAIAARALAESRGLEVSDLRGLVLAASLFCACLLGLTWSAKRFGFEASIAAAAHDLTQLARCAPATSFIPAPPGLARIGLTSLSELEPKRAVRSGAELFDFLDDWLAQEPPTAEISR
jgi:hypothetical protein